MDSLREIVEQCQQDSVDWFGEEASQNLTMYALGLAGETGEFCDELKKLVRGSQPAEEAIPKMQVELIDVFIYICNIAALLHIDIGEVYDAKRGYNVQRFGSDSGGAPSVDERVRGSEGEAVVEGS